ncbi:MAG: HEAT repeat domain-containing protein [Acidobacteria bacterium]|nr:HEAT repeat domain-containing protein [Acidobacteriota bacterium]
MLDSKQVKNLGLRFARALQMTVKTAGVFTIEHKSCERPVQQSFLLLNNLLKEVGQFTFGFVDNQVMLNNLLTTDPTVRHLETEFLKRGVAGITFEPGLTLSRYKKVVHVLAASTAVIEAAGGFLAFLDQNEVEGVRILPAARNQKKNEQGDTILETDSESYILSKQNVEDRESRDFLDSVDALLESGCFDPSMRTEVLSNIALQGAENPGPGFGGGSPYGVPINSPTLAGMGQMLGPAAAFPGSDGGGGARRSLHAAAGQGPGRGSSTRGLAAPLRNRSAGVAAGPATGGSAATGQARESAGDQSSVGAEDTAGAGGAFPIGQIPGPECGTLLELVEASVRRSLVEQRGNPEKSYASLARILRNTGVDKILEYFPEERRQELRTLTPEQLAAEYIEDTALGLAGAKLKAAGQPSQKLVIEEEVVHLLGRSLQATHMADRLAQKLTKFIQDYAVPANIQEKIREELQWTALNSTKKYARLMELKHYSNIDFRRLLEFSKELVNQRDMDRATTLGSHYFEFLDDPKVQIGTTELSRVPELIRSIPLAQVGFAPKTAERLVRVLVREDLSDFVHFQAASALTVLGQSVAMFENFQDVLSIALALESSSQRNLEKHRNCCLAGLAHLIPAAAVERIIELYLQQRGDSGWAKTAATLLRFASPGSIEMVFAKLVGEQQARNRLALVRLAGQLGKESLDVARRYLDDERWYVVRNICSVLAELADPNLVEDIVPALEHSDARVQQAALKTLAKSRSRNKASVLAASLPKLTPDILDEALDELMFLKDRSAVEALERFVSARASNVACLRKAVQALGAINDDAALHALGRLFRTEELEPGVRQAALSAISRHPSGLATGLLRELASSWGPLAEEARNELEKRKSV